MSRKIFICKKISVFLAVVMLLEIFCPAVCFALTGGPSQPEVRSFSPAGATEMVDLFTGDFAYNIPLLDIDGYPLSLSYSSNPTMDQEASWVGLGWSLNPGTLNRNLRGLPDDFNGDKVEREISMKDEITIGVGLSPRVETFGLFGIEGSVGIFYNNYRGFGFEATVNPSLNFSKSVKLKEGNGTASASIGLDLTLNSQTGLHKGIGLSFGLAQHIQSEEGANKSNSYFGIGATSSLRGLKDLSINTQFNRSSESNFNKSSFGLRGRYSFNSNTVLPSTNYSFANSAVQIGFFISGSIFGFDNGAKVRGYVNTQSLRVPDVFSRAAFGYFHLDKSNKWNTALQDFNREKPSVYMHGKPILPMPFGTHDLFVATGQGMSGQFRAFRNDVGIFRDPETISYGIGTGDLSFEAGAGSLFDLGVDITPAFTERTTSKWEEKNGMVDHLAFTKTENKYESAYVKATNEMNQLNESFYENIGAEKPKRIDLNEKDLKVNANSKFEIQLNKQPHSDFVVNDVLQKATDKRERRNKVFSYLNALEASHIGLDKSIVSYKPLTEIDYCNNETTPISRNATYREEHHMSEVTILNEAGSRYVYGIPVYNTLQKEATFNVNPNGTILSGGKISYTPNVDNTKANSQGRNNYFSSETLPAYAHSFLLTSILSPDYIDRDEEGVDVDDFGNALKFNYTLDNGFRQNDPLSTLEPYKWRVPYEQNKARHSKGYNFSNEDDKGSYLYGEKEIWYVHSMESKTMVAYFYLSERKDALGVKGENGEKDETKRLKKLDKIELYAKSEIAQAEIIEAETNIDTPPIPIKTVVFTYKDTGELCQGVPNHVAIEGGKLTLEKIHFTYGKNERGSLNAYKFKYGDSDEINPKYNPSYNNLNYDRWGSFKKHNEVSTNPNYPNNNLPPVEEFPYTLQEEKLNEEDERLTDKFAKAWNLTEIELPTGSIIKVQYESDDYAYVQDKRAGQMMFLSGLANKEDGSTTEDETTLYWFDDGLKMNNRVKVVLPNPVEATSEAEAKKIIKKRYFEDVGSIYFQCKVNVSEDAVSNEDYDYVKGYMNYNFDDVSVFPSDNNSNIYDEIAIKIDPVNYSGKDYHPISVSGFQSLKIDFPEIANGGVLDLDITDPKEVSLALLSQATSILDVFRSYFKSCAKRERSNKVDLERSWIRLANPNFHKLGGGSRVKEISISDEWTYDSKSEYGQKYFYEDKININGEEIKISSGVASNEPLLGNEENLMRKPVTYEEELLLTPSAEYYIEEPIGESLFPSSIVGYSKVKVEPFGRYKNVEKNGSGFTINEYYTSKDFPTKSEYTHLDNSAKIDPFTNYLPIQFIVRKEQGVTQGFVVEVNDMHGKQKGSYVYSENSPEKPISFTEYHYKTDGENDQKKQLNNTVKVTLPDGTIEEKILGVNIDLWQEMQDENSNIKVAGIKGNVDGFYAVFPALIPVPLPAYVETQNRFKSAVTTKLISRIGILDKVTVGDLGSVVSTINDVYDSETGSVIQTQTINEFDNPIYNFSYPAHWAYEGMGHSSDDIGAVLKNVSVNTTIGNFDDPTDAEFFKPGDELYIEENNVFIGKKYYIAETHPGEVTIIDGIGEPLPLASDYTFKIVRTGKRNILGASIGQVAALENMTETSNLTINQSTKILNAQSCEFSDSWHMPCGTIRAVSNNFIFNMNPYSNGLMGNWRKNKLFAYHTELDQDNLDIENSGIFKDFNKFWEFDGSLFVPNANDQNWIVSSESIFFDFSGNLLQQKDAIGNHISQHSGYGDGRIISQANNSIQEEVLSLDYEEGFFENDCFSIPGFLDLQEYGFPLGSPFVDSYSNSASHTGKYSLYSTVVSLNIPVYDYDISECPNSPVIPSYLDNPVIYEKYMTDGKRISPICESCLPQYKLHKGKKYVLSAWVACEKSIECGVFDIDLEIEIKSSGNIIVDLVPEGPIIDGWQRIYSVFEVPSNTATSVVIEIVGLTNGGYVDDFRIHPTNSTMVTHVYDPTTLRLMAQLDENNYATFYEYSDEGHLVRTKRETEKGIVTISETRDNIQPNNQ